jgi:hypothetical protein
MERELLRVNILSIAGAGLLMLLTGILLYVFKANIGTHMRFFLPIPPLGVAAYILVFNIFRHYGGQLPAAPAVFVREIAWGTAVAAAVFLAFSLILLVGIRFVQKSS